MHQVTSSFTHSEAMNRLSALSEKERLKGIVACSAGNHVLGVADASELHGVSSTSFIPKSVDSARKEMLEHFSSSVHVIGETYDECEAKARQVAHELQKTFISPYNDPLVIAGQGTIGIELREQVPNLEVVPVAV